MSFRQQPEIRTPEAAREAIVHDWLPAIEAESFEHVTHKDELQAGEARENRRTVLFELGATLYGRGTIRSAVAARELSDRTGLPHQVIYRHLQAEARRRVYLRVVRRGGPGRATVYKLHVDRFRNDADLAVPRSRAEATETDEKAVTSSGANSGANSGDIRHLTPTTPVNTPTSQLGEVVGDSYDKDNGRTLADAPARPTFLTDKTQVLPAHYEAVRS